jgi:hypothetical protein
VKNQNIESDFKDKLKEFYKTLNLENFFGEGDQYQETNELYAKKVFGEKFPHYLKLTDYSELEPKTFAKIVQSVKDTNLIINEEEIRQIILLDYPNKLSLQVAFEEKYKTPFEDSEFDSDEIKLFKSIVTKNQGSFSKIINSETLDPSLKDHAIGFCKALAGIARDIEVIKFLIRNKIDVINFSFSTPDTNPISGYIAGTLIDARWCNRYYFDEELFNLLLENGTDINIKSGSTSLYFDIIVSSAQEDLAIKLLDKVIDINQLDDVSDPNHTDFDSISACQITDSCLGQAIWSKKYKLAEALIEKGANVNYCKEPFSIWNNAKSVPECARLIVASNKLNETEKNRDIKYYNNVKSQVDFAQKSAKDIAWLESKGFGKWDNLLEMLRFYVKTYKEKDKFKDLVLADKEGFFAKNATDVVNSLKLHISKYWPYSLHRSNDTSCILNQAEEVKNLPEDLIMLIGYELFEGECQKILGDSSDLSHNSSVEN